MFDELIHQWLTEYCSKYPNVYCELTASGRIENGNWVTFKLITIYFEELYKTVCSVEIKDTTITLNIPGIQPEHYDIANEKQFATFQHWVCNAIHRWYYPD